MTHRPGLIIETDIFSDVDDVGAIALAHHHADAGRVDLLAIGVNTPSRYGAPAVEVINRHFRRDVPVGRLLPVTEEVFDPDYARLMATRFPSPAGEGTWAPAVDVHRRALQAAPDGSVTVVSLGFFHNLAALLAGGPDGISPLPGVELLRRKVSALVVMGGWFPVGIEFNVAETPELARRVTGGWPTDVFFVGWEVGVDVVTGRSLSLRDDGDPVAAAYRAFTGPGAGRESWDPLTVQFAVEGVGETFGTSEPGTVEIDDEGCTSFQPDPRGRHRYVVRRRGAEATAAALDAILERSPAHRDADDPTAGSALASVE